MILYWARLITSKENKLSKMIYSLIYKLYEKDLFHSTWISSVKNILDSAGFSGIWTNQFLPKSPDNLNTILKLRLHDQFIQNWNGGITKGGKCTVYRIIKNTFGFCFFGFEKYLTELPVNNRIVMTKFRCRNHRLPIEAGCRAQTQRNGYASIATTSLMNTTLCYTVRYSVKSVKNIYSIGTIIQAKLL